MKKFIMVSPRQKEGQLHQQVYKAVDNPKLQYNKATCFPILATINGYVNKGEDIQVISVTEDYECSQNNLEKFKVELEELSKENGFSYTLKVIPIPFGDTLDVQLEMFQKLIDVVEDNDTLYACMSFGSKPTPLIENLALNYAYRIRKNVNVDCIVYGGIEFISKEASIYDITSIFYMDEIVKILSESKVKNPTEHIKALLTMNMSTDIDN